MNNLNLAPLYPEIFLVVATSAILLIDMFLSDARRNLTYLLSLASLAVCAALTLVDFNNGQTTYTFYNMFVSDPMSNLLKLFSYLAVGLTLIYSRQYATDREMLTVTTGGEFYVLALFSLVGQMVMISANNFLIIYLGLELMSLSLYALVALRRDHTQSTEAAMKYFILGAMASGFLLYGISMLYGATGSLDLTEVARVTASGTVNRMVLVFGIVFVVAGLAFKLGAAPFHMWVPDVYQGAPTVGDAAAGRRAEAGRFRHLHAPAGGRPVDAGGGLAADADRDGRALDGDRQHHRDRADQFEAHAGLLDHFADGLHAAGPAVRRRMPAATPTAAASAYSSAMFYAITYVLTTLGTFGVIMLLSRAGFEAENLDDFKGLNQRSPWFAAVMMVLLLSLAGVPPMMGFYAKLAVLQSVLGAGAVVAVHRGRAVLAGRRLSTTCASSS